MFTPQLLVVYLGKERLTQPIVVSTFHQRSSSLFFIQSNCTYAWNILQEHNTNLLWANGHSTQGLYKSTKYFKRETLLRIEWHDNQLNHFHVN
jgi:hypothetical protein